MNHLFFECSFSRRCERPLWLVEILFTSLLVFWLWRRNGYAKMWWKDKTKPWGTTIYSIRREHKYTIVRILKIKGLSFSVVGLIHLDVRMKLKHLFELLLVLFRRVSELGNVDLKLSIPDHWNCWYVFFLADFRLCFCFCFTMWPLILACNCWYF